MTLTWRIRRVFCGHRSAYRERREVETYGVIWCWVCDCGWTKPVVVRIADELVGDESREFG